VAGLHYLVAPLIAFAVVAGWREERLARLGAPAGPGRR